MPTETFFNLPEDKRQRIIDAAVQEFGAHTFHNASLSRIVRRAGIPKGSMYQYFEDKMDLYLFVFDLATQKKMEVGERARSARPDADVFDRIRTSMNAGIEFAREHPSLAAIGRNLLRETDPEVVGRTVTRFRQERDAMLEQWLQEAVGSGDIDEGINIATARWMVAALAEAITDLVVADRASFREITELADDCLDILERGMRPVQK